MLSVLWWLPAGRRERAQALPDRAIGSPTELELLQPHPVEDRGRRRRRARPRRRRREPDRAHFLPAHDTDFAFASLAEQRGFFGASVLLLLYLLIVWRGLKIVTTARDLFGAIVAAGIVFAFLVQVFVNVGMTMGIAPITGIPLPFISVGGSSMISNLAAVGILLSIHARGGRRRQ